LGDCLTLFPPWSVPLVSGLAQPSTAGPFSDSLRALVNSSLSTEVLYVYWSYFGSAFKQWPWMSNVRGFSAFVAGNAAGGYTVQMPALVAT